jgi:NTP pyrophosphatase (non-canonical NTP hydrolase)
MNNNTKEEIYKRAIKNWGINSQIDMFIEESAELTKAFLKLRRARGTDAESECQENIKEEIADVMNCIEQMRYFFGEKEIDSIREAKLERLKTILKY